MGAAEQPRSHLPNDNAKCIHNKTKKLQCKEEHLSESILLKNSDSAQSITLPENH